MKYKIVKHKAYKTLKSERRDAANLALMARYQGGFAAVAKSRIDRAHHHDIAHYFWAVY